MAISVKSNISVGEAVSNIDAKYGPYSSKQDVLDSLVADGSNIMAKNGLTIGIEENGEIVEYIFQYIPDNPTANDITVNNLIKKEPEPISNEEINNLMVI